MLPRRGKLSILRAVAEAALVWTLPVAALLTTPWLGFGAFAGDFGVVRPIVVGLAFAFFVAVFVAAPLGPVAWALRERLHRVGDPTQRLSNVTAELAIALGVDVGRVGMIDSVVPTVIALPLNETDAAYGTSGCVDLMRRDELEALMASQLVVAADHWVRIATRAQLGDALRFPLVLAAAILNPITLLLGVPLILLTIFGRTGDAARDLAADAAALEATRHPDALIRAYRKLAPATLLASQHDLGVPGFLADPFSVLSLRRKSTRSLEANGRVRRSWSSEDENAYEMKFRAERMARAWSGSTDAFAGLRDYRRGFKRLGSVDDPPELLTLDDHLRARHLVESHTAARATIPEVPPGWYTDPHAVHGYGGYRWWNGRAWTASTWPPAQATGNGAVTAGQAEVRTDV